MDNLPLELIYKIFSNFKIKELYKLRILSKKWNRLILGFKVKEDLVMMGIHEYPCKLRLFTEPVNRQWLSSIKKLSIKVGKYEAKFEDVNKLTKLEYLHLRGYHLGKKTLKLPELKYLSSDISRDTGRPPFKKSELTIDCPKLSSLYISSYYDGQRYLIERDFKEYEMKFKYPESVTTLIIQEYDTFEIFKNCKTIFYWGEIERISAKSFLSEFPKLEELQLRNAYPSSDVKVASTICHDKPCQPDKEPPYIETIRHLRECLNQLLVQKRKLKMDSLKIYLKGMDISQSKGILQDDGLEEKKLSEFIIENHENKKELDFKEFTYYNSMVNFGFSDIFVKKLPSIRELRTCEKLKDQNHLLLFIEKLWKFANLKTLYLDQTSINQAFVDRLPAICSLKYLDIYNQQDLKLNFDFLMRMKRLKEFDTDQKVSLETIRRKLLNIEEEKKFIFYFDGASLKIAKDKNYHRYLDNAFYYIVSKNSFFLIEEENDKTAEFKDLNDFMNYLKNNLILEKRKQDQASYFRYSKEGGNMNQRKYFY